MSPRVQPYVAPEAYLALERQATYRSEYVNSRVYALAGASHRHNLIAGNTFAELRAQLRGRPCFAYVNDMRVKVSSTSMYTYPDVVGLCGAPQFEDEHADTLLNPSALIEVLSDSTERYDRGKKFGYYRSLPSLGEYLLVAQDEYRIDYYRREADGRWLIGDARGRDASLALVVGGCTLVLADVYERVTLPG